MFCGFGQTNSLNSVIEDGHNYKLNAEKVSEIYKSGIVEEFRYVNGRERYLKYRYSQANPFLKETFGVGKVYSNNFVFPNLILTYDIHNEELLNTTNLIYQNQYFVELNKALIDSFTLKFEDIELILQRIQFPENTNIEMKDGFYEVYNWKRFSFLVKHTKLKLTDHNGKEIYSYKPLRYVLKDEKYFKISSRRQLMTVFPTKKQQLRRILKNSPYRYKEFETVQMVKLLESISFN